jgi:hypothetical protein
VRQDRVGDGSWKLEGAQAVVAAISQIIDDDADGGKLAALVGILGASLDRRAAQADQ